MADQPPGALGQAAQALSTPTGAMTIPRTWHEAATLADGRVLVVGGLDPNGWATKWPELYRPATNDWQLLGSLPPRYFSAVVRLANGKVLIAGGRSDNATSLDDAYLFDPATSAFVQTGRMGYVRSPLRGVLLPDGRVLVVGGQLDSYTQTQSAELYTPSTGTWSFAASMKGTQTVQTVTLLADGRVLVTGTTADGTANRMELYMPATNTWTALAPSAAGRKHAGVIALPSGKVLMVGGATSPTTAELYDPASNTWTATGALAVGRQLPRLLLLPSGEVLAVSGSAGSSWLSSVERWSPTSGTWTTEPALGESWTEPTASLLADGQVLLVGKRSAPGALLYSTGGACVPTTCSAQAKTCGSIPDGCGGTLACGSCPDGQSCVANTCAIPSPPPPAPVVVTASYDSTWRVPVCGSAGSECRSGTLLNGRAQLGPEANAPNTLGGACADGTAGSYHVDESLDALRVVSVDGSAFAPGKQVRIEATAWVWGASSDFLDLWAAADASSPSWTLLGTLQPAGNGSQVLSMSYTLPARSGLQVVRGVFRYGGSASTPCQTSSFTDHDDLAFMVGPVADTRAPTTVINAPQSGAVLHGTVTVFASGADEVGVAQLEILQGETVVASGTTGSLSWSWDTAAGADGAYVLRSRASDAAGNVTTSADVTVTVDNTPPSLYGLSPADGATVQGTTTLAAGATDVGSVVDVRFYVDGFLKGTATAAPYQVDWDSTGVPNGPHTLLVRARDAQGNSRDLSAQFSTLNDLQPPGVSLTSPANDQRVSGTVALAAAATDDVGVTQLQVRYGSTVLASSSTGSLTGSWDTTALNDGPHMLYAYASDASGKEAQSAGVRVIVDNLAPWVSGVSPSNGAVVEGAITLSAQVTDMVGVSEVHFALNGVVVGVDTSAPYELAWDSRLVGNGQYTILVTGRDAAGHEAESSSWFYVNNDRSPPSVVITSPQHGAHVRGTVAVTASATDWKGVTGLELFTGSTSLASGSTDSLTASWDTAVLADGVYTLGARAFDAAGNVGNAEPVEVTVDNTAPELVALTPAGGDTLTGVTTLSAELRDAAGITEVRFELDGSPIGTVAAPPYALTWNTATVANGDHTLVIVARDLAGNERTGSTSFSTRNDLQAPEVALTAPTGGVTLSGEVTVSAAATDDIAVTRIELYDGDTLIGSGGSSLLSVVWNTRQVSNGPHVLRALAYDAAGRIGHSAQLSVLVGNDVTAPVVVLGAPAGGTAVRGVVALSASATDEVGIAELELLDGSTPLATSAASGTLSASWDTTLLADGARTLQARARDAAGNVGTSASVVLMVDNTAPGLAISAPLSGATVQGTASLEASASDAVGISSVRFAIDGATVGTDTQAPYALAWDSRAVANGPHVLSVVARDTAGNERELSTSLSVLNDHEAPQVALAAPGSGALLTGSVTLGAAASDDIGVTRVEFLDGDTVLGSDLSAPFSFVWNTRSAGNGAHVLAARAYDASGKVAVSAGVPVTLDNDLEAPTVAIQSPVSGATVSGSVTGSIVAEDNLGVVAVRLLVDGQPYATYAAATVGFSWDSRSVSNGTHTLEATAHDAAGNVGSSTVVHVQVDNDYAAPLVALTQPAEGATVRGSLRLTAAASDNVGVARVDFYAGSTLVGSSTHAPYALEWNTFDAPNGPHALTAKARDAAGNLTASSTVTVQVSNTAPLVASFSPTLLAPLCAGKATACDSGALLVGRGPVGPEHNAPNAVDGSCTDGSSGSFHVSESLDRLLVYSEDGGLLRVGAAARIIATVWASSTNQDDALDLYVARDAKRPSWTRIATLSPEERDARTLVYAWTPPSRGRYIVRGVFRYQGSASPCPSGVYTDVDDLVIDVQ